MSATFAINCPYCGKATRAPADALYRCRVDGQSRSVADLCGRTRDHGDMEVEFGSHCPECGDPLALRVRGPAALFAQVVSGAARVMALEDRQHELTLVKSFPEWKPKPKPVLSPYTPVVVAELLPMLKEDHDKGRDLDGLLAGARRCLDALLSALEAAPGQPPPRPGRLPRFPSARPAAGDHERRIRALARSGVLTAAIADAARRLPAADTVAPLAKAVVGDYLALVEVIEAVAFQAPHRLNGPPASDAARTP